MKRRKIIFLVFLLFVIEIGYIFYSYLRLPYDEQYYQKVVEILPGTSVYEIGVILEYEKLINSPLLFLLYAKLSGFSSQLKAGRYLLNSRMSLSDLIRQLKTGAEALSIPVTIPEGYALRQIAEILEEKGISKIEDFLRSVNSFAMENVNFSNNSSLEGYLFPDTYQFYPGIPAEKIISKMYNRFCSLVYPLYSQYSGKTRFSLPEIIVLASLIEKEAQIDKEKKFISAVFHNRLKRGMLLGCEPTVRYILGKFTGPLTKEELLVDSPYNTYLKRGLPPAPICNPGLKSIEAALDPAKVGYLYFVSRNDGTHQFTYSLSEHQAAVYKYQKRVVSSE